MSITNLDTRLNNDNRPSPESGHSNEVDEVSARHDAALASMGVDADAAHGERMPVGANMATLLWRAITAEYEVSPVTSLLESACAELQLLGLALVDDNFNLRQGLDGIQVLHALSRIEHKLEAVHVINDQFACYGAFDNARGAA